VPYLFRANALGEARLGFYQKMVLAQALTPTHGEAPIWDAIAKLNALRNNLAHNLEACNRAKKIDDFISAVVKDADNFPSSEMFGNFGQTEQLILCIGWILGALSAIQSEHEFLGRLLRIVPRTVNELITGKVSR
jgi:hypothetical protein